MKQNKNSSNTAIHCDGYALEKAAKMICSLKCGLCPMREKDFAGCPSECSENTKPWRCWIAYLKTVVPQH
jgi:hypothetical protein